MFGMTLVVFIVVNIYAFHQQKLSSHVILPVLKNPSFMPSGISTKQTFQFVPYWTLEATSVLPSGTHYIYFGIIPTTGGIDLTGEAYRKLPIFIDQIGPEQEKLLAVQMINNAVNESVLRNQTMQKNIMDQTLQVVKKNRFDGVVLDFEFSALAFPSITNTITQFITTFAQAVHQEHKKFFVTLYGDVFYRVRPFNVSLIGQKSDGIFIMAYDFHKAAGDPGANFPLIKGAADDYDFTTMLADFTRRVSPDKLIVTFGMFGYDWKVSEKGQSITPGIPVSTLQIQQNIIASCSQLHCILFHDPLSAETEITYSDTQKQNHIVWYEDTNSVNKKMEVVQKAGITNTAFWAYGYY